MLGKPINTKLTSQGHRRDAAPGKATRRNDWYVFTKQANVPLKRNTTIYQGAHAGFPLEGEPMSLDMSSGAWRYFCSRRLMRFSVGCHQTTAGSCKTSLFTVQSTPPFLRPGHPTSSEVQTRIQKKRPNQNIVSCMPHVPPQMSPPQQNKVSCPCTLSTNYLPSKLPQTRPLEKHGFNFVAVCLKQVSKFDCLKQATYHCLHISLSRANKCLIRA